MNIAGWASAVQRTVGQVIYGKEEVIEKLLVALLCEGHVLLEDVPGVGKTILARAFSTAIGGRMQRIQCTPDLLPADVLGVTVYDQVSGEFNFRHGPVMTNVLLVDEINRATPRTQSALLEAMEEGRITVDGRTMELPRPFFVIATENPVEFEGTFPLPEAQKDRFFLSTTVGYPPGISEIKIMESHRRITHPVKDLVPVTDTAQVVELQDAIRSVPVDDFLVEYILDIVQNTRKDVRLTMGASPRASMALYGGLQAIAAVRGRNAASPEDLRSLAFPVLWKRISVKPESMLQGTTEKTVIEDIVERTALRQHGTQDE